MARRFNGTSSYDTFASSLIGASPYPFTVGCWVWPWVIAGATPQILFSFNDAAFNNGINVFLQNGLAGMNTVVSGTVGTAVYVPFGVTNFRWYYAILVATSATNRRLYMNLSGYYGNPGAPPSVASTASQALAGLAVSSVGAGVVSGTGVDFFNGLIDELAIWNVALTPGEIKVLSARVAVATAVRYKSLKAFFKFGYAGTDRDMVSNRTLTLVGSPLLDPGYVGPFIDWPTQRLVIQRGRSRIPPPFVAGRGRPVVQACG